MSTKIEFEIKRIYIKNVAFQNFKSIKCAFVVSFQQFLEPFGSHGAAKPYYSAKHQFYGYKTETSVIANRLCARSSSHTIENVSDIKIFLKGLPWHWNNLKRKIVDEETLSDSYAASWSVLQDCGYQGVHKDVRTVYSISKHQDLVYPINNAPTILNSPRMEA